MENLLRKEIMDIVKKLAEEDVAFDENTNLFEEGIIDSLGVANIIMALQDKYEIEISPEDIIPENLECVDMIVGMIMRYKEGNN